MENEKDILIIVCDKCGHDKSRLSESTGPKGTAKMACCLKCGNITFRSFDANPNYINPNNPLNVACPFCKSTDCKKISAASKVGKVALFGVFAAGSVSKTWHCNACGSNFG